VVRWLQQNAYRLTTVDPSAAATDLGMLPRVIGNASVVGLGEETHGTHELIDIKARLTEYLIGHLGFTTFVMENDWGSSRLLDQYIHGGSGNLSTVMSQSLFGSWQTQEYEALFAWMRAYNSDPSHPNAIQFLGMDCQAVSQSDFDAVQQYVQQVDAALGSTVQSLFAPIISSSLPYPYGKYTSLDAATKQQYQTQAQTVYDLLQAHQQAYMQRSSPQQFAGALQEARVIVEFTNYLNASTQDEALARYYQRDGFMAENVEWIVDHLAAANPKIIVWAHDVHIADDTTYPSQDKRNMGGELRAHIGASYLPIGTTLYSGTYQIYDYPHGVAQPLPPVPMSSYNGTLGQVGIPLYLLDLRQAPSGTVADWFAGKGAASQLLLYGLGGDDLSDRGPLSQWFNVIVHVQNSTPSKHF
jgi:erythromycin esterase